MTDGGANTSDVAPLQMSVARAITSTNRPAASTRRVLLLERQPDHVGSHPAFRPNT